MTRISALALVAIIAAAPLHAQSFERGLKAGVNRASVASVPKYYEWWLSPGATVESTARKGFVGGVFFAVPVTGWVALQGDVLLAQKRHSVKLYENKITFERDYVEAAGLVRLAVPVRDEHRIYVAGGPVASFRVGEGSRSQEPGLRRGDRDNDAGVVRDLAYGAPELLRRSYGSAAVAGGWSYRRFLVEVRFTQGLQSIFRNRDGLIAGLVSVGGHEPSLRRSISEFAPLMESAKPRDMAVLAGIRF